MARLLRPFRPVGAVRGGRSNLATAVQLQEYFFRTFPHSIVLANLNMYRLHSKKLRKASQVSEKKMVILGKVGFLPVRPISAERIELLVRF